METVKKIHSESGEVLIEVSPLINFSQFDLGSNQDTDLRPLHVKATKHLVEKQTELSPLHDFMGKLRQPGVLENLKEYVRWQAQWREGYAADAMTFEQALKKCTTPRASFHQSGCDHRLQLPLRSLCGYGYPKQEHQLRA